MKADRRSLLAGGVMAGSAALGLAGCGGEGQRTWPGRLLGADFTRGHALRDLKPDRAMPQGEEQHVSLLIAGGGVAGLAAGWRLAEAGFTDFTLLELEDEPGGNARGGANAVTAYPWGAHYLPIPNREAKALIHMLKGFGMITGEENGAPVYDPYQVCADLDERLFWQGAWQADLFPASGLSAQDIAQRDHFSAMMATFQKAIGKDGRPAFASPMALSSRDEAYTALDRLSFAAWLDQQHVTSPVLRAYIRYCCRDDYGTEPEQVSAWAGVRYFACRRGWAARGVGDRELTWPEGNARLSRLLAGRIAGHIRKGHALVQAREEEGGVAALVWDYHARALRRYRADALILAMPQFVAQHLVPGLSAQGLSYAPWVVANVALSRQPAGPGVGVAWDNVSAASDYLGYVVATHQTASGADGPTVVTWYTTLSQGRPEEQRRMMLTRPLAEWQKLIADDLLAMNPDLEGAIQSIDVWRWGHAMIRPTPGFLTNPARLAAEAMTGPIFHAHSDISGLSLFEEAHYRGVLAAEGALSHLDMPYESLL
jgi:hypothetical protein